MNDKYRELLEQYDIQVLSTFRSRGTFQCETDKGLALLKEYHGSLKKLALEYEWKAKLAEAGFCSTDQYMISREESLVVYDRYRTPFVLKHYFRGRECDLSDSSDIYAACRNLAFLHQVSDSLDYSPFEDTRTESVSRLFARRNRELRAIRKYISRINHKNSFELLYLKYFDDFYKEADNAWRLAEAGQRPEPLPACGICHGAYHHHNILILPDSSVATVGFEHMNRQPYLMDFYLFIRKTLEKNHYSYSLFETALSGYSSLRPLSEEDLYFLYLLFLYPEKFRKLSNQYYNHKKSWIPPKMETKLRKLQEQNRERLDFLKLFFHNIS